MSDTAGAALAVRAEARAESTLARFLELSLATAKWDTAAIGRVQQCYPDGEVEPLYVLADYRILGSAPRGETTYVRAEVVTAGEGAEGADGWRVRAGTRVDTAEWSVAPDSMRRGLVVCGLAHSGIDFQPVYSTTQRSVRYDPSRAAVLGLADSLRRRRGAGQ